MVLGPARTMRNVAKRDTANPSPEIRSSWSYRGANLLLFELSLPVI